MLDWTYKGAAKKDHKAGKAVNLMCTSRSVYVAVRMLLYIICCAFSRHKVKADNALHCLLCFLGAQNAADSLSMCICRLSWLLQATTCMLLTCSCGTWSSIKLLLVQTQMRMWAITFLRNPITRQPPR